MGAKARCSQCKNYFDKDSMLRTGLGGLGGLCSQECFDAYLQKCRDKRSRRKEHREKRFTGGRRLPGTCRDRVRRRDGEQCRWCGTSNELQLHHVFYRSEGGADTPRNLLTLCWECHARAHSNKRKYQRILLLLLYVEYVQDRHITVPAAFQHARQYPADIDLAREFSVEVHEANKRAAAA